MTKSRGILAPRRRWTEAELGLLRSRYPDTITKVLAAQLNRKLLAVYHKARAIGLQKSDAFNALPASGRLLKSDNRGGITRFRPGQTPQNKGLRRPGWHRGRMRETQFKKGSLSGRAAQIVKPLGTERISKDGYLERKVNNNLPFQRRWKFVHRLVWEAANGPIPEGHAVAFLPKRFTAVAEEITADRLELVTRAELARRNRMWTVYPKDLANAIHVLGQVKRRIRTREQQHAEQD